MKSFVSLTAGLFSLLFSVTAYTEGTWTTYIDRNNIYRIAVECEYVWCSTDAGVIRWNKDDGTYRWYTHNDTDEHGAVFYTAVDSRGNRWFISYGGGFSRYDGSNWETFTIKNISESIYVNALAVDSKDVVWIGYDYNCVGSFDGTTWKIYRAVDEDFNWRILKIVIDHSDVKWILTEVGRGVVRLDDEKWTRYTRNDEEKHALFKFITIDQEDVIWLASPDEIWSFDGKVWESHVVSFGTINVIAVDHDNMIWIGTSCGAACFDGSTWKTYTPDDGLAHRNVTSIAVDEDGMIWFGTTAGLSLFNGMEWRPYYVEGPGSNSIRAVAVDGRNIKWFGGEVSTFDGVKWKTVSSFSAHSIAFDRNSTVWFTSWHDVVHFDGILLQYFTEEAGIIPLENVYSIVVDLDNVKWIGREKGVTSFNGSTWKTYSFSDKFYNWRVKSIAVDQNNEKWFGTNWGVSRFDGTTWTHYRRDVGWREQYVNVIAVGKDNVIWIGTKYGVASFDGTTWMTYTSDDGLVSDEVYAIAVEQNGIVWFGTHEGISRFDGSEWITYTVENGLAHNYVYAIEVDYDGVKWFGTRGGVSSFVEEPPAFTDLSNAFPETLTIHGVYPNPFNALSAIDFSIPSDGFLSLIIYNVTGQKIRELISGHLIAGRHTCVWDGRDDNGYSVSSGLYIPRIIAGNSVTTGKMVLVK